MKQALDFIRSKSSGPPERHNYAITINFHPDRLTVGGNPILAAMARDLRLKSQFETGTSNGGLSAYTGGHRWHWESRVFNGIYDACLAAERPVYGALNHHNLATGAAPRFGSAYFRLSKDTLKRSTFCYPDSYLQPEHFATTPFLTPLLVLANAHQGDPLDGYIEAQIHGGISLQSDVDALVLDPVFQGTEIEQYARQLPVSLEWHAGYRLHTDQIAQHIDYRGKAVVDLARKITPDGWLTARLLGEAIHSQGHDAQQVKKLWHYLACFGYQDSGHE